MHPPHPSQQFSNSNLLVCLLALAALIMSPPSCVFVDGLSSPTSSSATNANANTASLRGKAFASSLPVLEPSHRRLYVVRHGQTDWNLKGLIQGGGYDTPLNNVGEQQAAQVASELSGILFSMVCSSHLQRSLQTAKYLAANKRVTDERLGEMRFGDLEGLAIRGLNATEESRQRFQEMKQKMKHDIDFKWPGEHGESTRDVSRRGKEAIESLLLETKSGDHLCIVAHGRFNKVLLATLLWNDPSRFAEMEQGNTCINAIDYNELTKMWSPILINYTDHALKASAKEELLEHQPQEQQQQSSS